MSETLLEAGTIKVTGESIQFSPVTGENAVEGRIPVAAITGVRRKGLLLPFVWPALTVLSAELFAAFLILSNLEAPVRQPLADLVIGFGQRYGIDAANIFQKYYDSHHLFLISMGFLAITLLPPVIAGLIRKNRLILRLKVPAKPGVFEITVAAGASREALTEVLEKIIA